VGTEQTVATLLAELGFHGDPEMADSPRRVVEWLSAFVPDTTAPQTSVCATSSQAPVCMDAIPFHSLCAHHLVPFFGTASIVYIPRGKLAGLGSLSRAVTHFAKRPQLQERMGEQIADHLYETLQPLGLVVAIEARQLCVELSQHMQPTVRTWAIRGELPDGLMPRW
jgi:GTP cyclohydrolase IA